MLFFLILSVLFKSVIKCMIMTLPKKIGFIKITKVRSMVTSILKSLILHLSSRVARDLPDESRDFAGLCGTRLRRRSRKFGREEPLPNYTPIITIFFIFIWENRIITGFTGTDGCG